jgi:hypothetical protein
MAREHARVKLSIWEDDDFRLLSSNAQHLYFVLMTHPKLDYCGVTDWRPARIAPFAGAWTTEAVEIAAQELSEQLYIVIDTESEEVLIRSFIRSDELLESPNMAVAMRKAHAAIASTALRQIIIHELVRLHDDKPDLKGWSKVSDLLKRPSLNPSDYPSFNPSGKGSGNPSGRPSGTGDTNPSASPSGRPSPTTAPATATAPATGPQLTTESRERNETLRASSDTEPTPKRSRCTRHRDGNPNDEPCLPCKKDREWDERIDAKSRRAEEEARRNCGICDGTGIVVDPDNNRLPTGRKCTDHRRTA